MFNKNLRYKDIIILALIIFVGFKVVDNYKDILVGVKGAISIITPFIYAFLIAYILNPIVKAFEKYCKVNRGVSVLLTYGVITGLIIVGGIFVIPSAIENITGLVKEFPSYMSTIEGWLNGLLQQENVTEFLKQTDTLEQITRITQTLGNGIITILQGSLTYLISLTTDVVKFFLGYLIAIYVLIDKEKMIENAKTLCYMILKKEKTDKIIITLRTYNNMIGTYIGIKAIDSTIIGAMAFVGLLLLGAPHVGLLAAIVGITNMIPYFGPLVGEVIGAFIGFFVSPMMGISIFILLLALQQFDAWYLDPKLIGDKVGVSAFWIIVAVTIGGGLFGPIGMLLGSPTIATIKVFYERRVERFKRENKEIVDNML